MLKGLRFQKRLRILPGLRINLSKSGASATVGTKGAGVNIGPGGITTNAGIPGTGLSYRQKITPKNRSAWIGVVTLVAGLAFAGWQNRDRIGTWLAPTETPAITQTAAPVPQPPAPPSQQVDRPARKAAATPTIRDQRARMLKVGGTIYVRRAGSVLRETQKPSAAALEKLPKGAAITVVAMDGPWTQVRHGENTGWMRTSVLGPKP